MDNFLFYTVKSKGTLPYTSKFLCFSLFSCFYSVVPYEVRLEAQEQAIRDCSYLLALIDVSERTGRINAQRAQYWGKKVRDVKYMCMAWRKREQSV